MKHMNIVITGSGVVSAIGGDKLETLESLRERRSGIGRMHHLRTFHDDLPVGEVRMSDGELREELGIPQEVPMTRTALFGIKALREALAEAGLPAGVQMPLISGTTVGGMEKTELYWHDFLTSDRHSGYIPLQGCGATTALIAGYFGRIAEGQPSDGWPDDGLPDDGLSDDGRPADKRFADVRFNDVLTPSTACSSAANAIIRAADMILAGEAEAVAAGGSECLSSFHHSGFNSLMILDREQCRPFDRTRAGLNLGEGAAYLILESEEHALRRGAKIIARLTGYSNRCDAFHQTASSPDGEGAYLSMTGALAMAGLAPEDIDYVNAHGTGTPNNDASESAALRRVFGEGMPAVSSTKSFTGHTTSASGSIESVFCLLALTHSFIPVSLGWKESSSDTVVPYIGEGSVRLNNIICNAFGFGGNDSSLIFSRYDVQDDKVPGPGSSFRAPETNSAVDGSEGVNALSDRHIYIKSMKAIPSDDTFSDYSSFVSPMEGRRMGKLMKRALATSLTALRDAGIEHPDAIITGTSLGSVADMEPVLNAVCENGGESVKPTNFMQSTHNTLSSLIAIKTHTHSGNCTWSQEGLSFEAALCDALTQLRLGRIDNALVGAFDELSPDVLEIQRRGGILKDAFKAGETAASFFLEADSSRESGFDEVCPDEVCPGEVCTDEACPDKVCQEENCSGEDGSGEDGFGQVEVLGAKTLFIPDENRRMKELGEALDRMLSAASLNRDDIDIVLTGRNGGIGAPSVGDAGDVLGPDTDINSNDAVYERLNALWEDIPQGRWKHILGEGFSASAAGFHAAVTWLLQGFIPEEFRVSAAVAPVSPAPVSPESIAPAPSSRVRSAGKPLRNIVIFNHSAGKHFSLIILHKSASAIKKLRADNRETSCRQV